LYVLYHNKIKMAILFMKKDYHFKNIFLLDKIALQSQVNKKIL